MQWAVCPADHAELGDLRIVRPAVGAALSRSDSAIRRRTGAALIAFTDSPSTRDASYAGH